MSGFFIGAIEMSEEKNLWERQENESSKAYQAFCIYRDLGAGRTLAAVSEKLRKSYDLIRRWSKNYFLAKSRRRLGQNDKRQGGAKSG